MNSEYITVFSPVNWGYVWISFLQAMILYWVVLIGLRVIGRRAFAQLGSQEMILLLLISEAANLGITHENGGFWGAIASTIAMLMTVYLVNAIPGLLNKLQPKAIVIMESGQYDKKLLKKHRITQDDLEKTGRKYGITLDKFESLTLEDDGNITGIVKLGVLLKSQ